MASAPPEPWPFLALFTTPRKEGPRRVEGLGFAHDGAIVTLSHIAGRAAHAELPGGRELTLEPLKERDGLALVTPEAPGGASGSLGAATGPVAVALANDDTGAIRIGQGEIERAGDRSVFVLDGRIGDYWSPSGSPVVQEDGTVVGIVGPTSSDNRLDMFTVEDIERLLEPEFELAGGVSADLVDPSTALSLEHDHLGLGVEVTMFAALIADRATPLPLSVGLFGEWGSGKSYFMALLRAEIERLSRVSPRHCDEIVQIGFNAWHYADTNLWASLGDEIFAQLAGPVADDLADEAREKEEARHAALRADLDDRLQSRKELMDAAARAEAETERLSAALQDAVTERRGRASALATAVLAAPALRSEVAPALDRLGVKAEADQIRLLAEELEDGRRDATDVRRAVAELPRWGIAAGVALAVVAVVAGVAFSKQIAGVAVAVLTLVTTAAAVAARIRSGLLALRQVADGLRRGEQASVSKQIADLRQAETTERMLHSQLDEVIQQVGELNRELTELEPGRRLYRFAAERAASDAYRGQLGLISTVRRDLEQLRKLMKEQWPEDHGEDDPPPIDRIVLYIDDLDRCSPEQVVEVLQAVHLLLAIDLFVVVVGVDPRWLLHSLRQEYRSLLTTGGEDDRWETTPQDYLEKIFNIPFALPRMTSTTFAELVESFVETERPAGPFIRGPSLVIPQEDGTDTMLDVAELSAIAEEHSEVASLQADVAELEQRGLTEGELTMIGELAPLVQTPREAKRLMNLYRMLRSTRDLSPASRFLGDERTPGEYQAVVILLGLLSGHARLLHDVLVDLRSRPKEDTWAAFATGLRSRDGEAWTQLADGLAGATSLVTLPDLTAFHAWAPRIARFSFLLSPYADGDELRA